MFTITIFDPAWTKKATTCSTGKDIFGRLFDFFCLKNIMRYQY
jgi:hypothetical protein